MSNPILKHFKYTHLPECPEKSAGLRKLLEAKDCFVRAAMEAPTNDEKTG